MKNDTEVICCCGGVVDGAQCEIGKERRSIKDKLKLSGGMFVSGQLGVSIV